MFNALKYTEELEKAGFSREQAEASVRLLIEVMNDDFATKANLDSAVLVMQSDLKGAVSELRSEFRSEFRSELGKFATEFRSEMNKLSADLRSEFSTKSEFQAGMNSFKSELRSEMKEMDIRHQASIRELEYKLTIKLGTMSAISIGLMATVLKLLQTIH